MGHRILVVNPGSTSTKVGLFDDLQPVDTETLEHGPDEISAERPVLDQMAMRLGALRTLLARWGVAVATLDAVVGRGGLLPPLPGGTYEVCPSLLQDLARAQRGEHASNLGAPIADIVAREAVCPAFVVDPVSVDEMWPVARITGLPDLRRESLCHALNIRATAHAHANASGVSLEELSLIVAHLGGGCSMAAVHRGRLVDVVNPRDEGPMSADRAGGLPSLQLARWVITERLDRGALERRLFREGGLYAHLGTRDLREAYRRADEGDVAAVAVLDALVYQVARTIGGLAACLGGRVDAILLTGGMAHEERLVQAVACKVAFIAELHAYPGEDELAALAAGAWRVLTGAESAQVYPYHAVD